jgi:hypothetical protein
MLVAVKKTAVEHLLIDEIGEPVCQVHRIDLVSPQRGRVGDAEAGNKFQRQHARSGIFLVDLGYLDRPVALELRAVPGGIVGLVRKVEFLQERVGEFLHHADRIHPGQIGDMLFRETREVMENGQVEIDHFPDVGPLDFNRDLCPVLQLGQVNLRDGSARGRLRRETGEKLLHGFAEFGLHDLLGQLAVKGWDAVMEFAKLDIQLVGNEIAARAQDLTELDEGRPQFLQGGAHPHGHKLLLRDLFV